MQKKHRKFLKKLLETPSPTGLETDIAEVVRNELAAHVDKIETNVMGSVHASLYGRNNGPSLMLAAHMDEIGLMVTYISDEGYLSVAAVGGVDAAILPGMRVDVHTQQGVLRGVVGRKPIHLIVPDERKNVTPLDQLVIDLGMPAKKVHKQVRVGDEITFAVKFERFGCNMAVSRAFDDKAGVWVFTRVLENLAAAGRAQGDVVFAATVQEEIGVRGGQTSAYGLHPDVALVFDVTHATDYPGIDKSKHGKIVCGKGPVIARGPNINPSVFERLVDAAEAEGIPYQIEAEPGVTGTDARAIQMEHGGIPCGLVSIPLRYMHTPTEVISLLDLENAVKLITRFALDLDEYSCFVPGMSQTPFVGNDNERISEGVEEREITKESPRATDEADKLYDDKLQDVCPHEDDPHEDEIQALIARWGVLKDKDFASLDNEELPLFETSVFPVNSSEPKVANSTGSLVDSSCQYGESETDLR